MQTTDVIIIGAGQAGLATSACLSRRDIEHVVLDRGRVAERWRSERWDSLRLLTPRWQSRLPGHAYQGPSPDGFMSMPEVIELFERYAIASRAPVQPHTRVLSLQRFGAGYRARTDRGDLFAKEVVVATGYCDRPAVPQAAAALRATLCQLTPSSYRNPASLPDGGVLVVGASSSGAQIADELARSGRHVSLAVGRHIRLPRRYRGADIMWWLDRIGSLDETRRDVIDLAASLSQPSLQLVGSEPARDLDLGTLQQSGVRLCGRLLSASGASVELGEDLERNVRAADAKLTRLLDRIDCHAFAEPAGTTAVDKARPRPIDAARLASPRRLSLVAEGITSVIWATGYERDYGWLRVPIFDARGEIAHVRGVTPAPGLYAMGLRFQHTRKSSFIDGVAADAEHIAHHIAERLGARQSDAA
jgi:putative flavoprotein involved in K+ transport